ncbi:MAG: DUF4251 domain-containing protein [Alistipes sp.]|nr:DUF4251 domain-containing protein [Alistipes sp.]MCD8173479.1 DUF4251 domain-containing protein [Alistipes sp.]
MKRLLLLCLSVCGIAAGTAAYGQAPQEESRHEQRVREREEKTREYCMYMDSLVRSHVYVFKPQSMQMQPAGRQQQIINPNFRMDVRADYIDLYLPFIAGRVPPYRTRVLNYTLTNIPEYRAEQSEDGQEWTITFSTTIVGSTRFQFTLTVTTCTGDAMLEIRSAENNTVKYNGFLTKNY